MFTEFVIDNFLETPGNNRGYVKSFTTKVLVLRRCVHLEEWTDVRLFPCLRRCIETQGKFQIKVTTGAKSRALSLQTQWGILSGPDAVFLILDKASITSVSLRRGDRCFSIEGSK